MTAVTVLGVLVALLVLPLLVALARGRFLGAMALRNIRRRRGEAVLVIAGSLLGTAIITSSFVVGDIVDGSITDAARTQLGPVDITLTTADPGHLDEVVRRVRDAGIADVDDVMAASSATAALEVAADADRDAAALPSVTVVELDLEVARSFGGDEAITGLADVEAADADGIVVHERTADRLGITEGDTLTLHAYGTGIDREVARVLPEVGLAGYGGAIVAPGTLDGLSSGTEVVAAPPRTQALVSLAGGVFDTRELSGDAVTELRSAVETVPGVEVEGVKATMLSDAEEQGGQLSELFTTIGSFSVIAGLLLLVNLFVMLAEERKTELGMLRALGFTRRRLTQAFAIEGTIYATIAAVVGATLGIGIGWAVAVAAGAIFGLGDQGLTFSLVVEPRSLAIGALTGLAMSLVTIWVTSVRIARLNVIRAIRDLPEPRRTTVRARTIVLGALGVVAGGTITAIGLAQELAIPLMIGVPVAAFCASPLVRRVLPERPARVLVAAVVLAWGIGSFPLFPDILGAGDLEIFVVQGVVLTAGAVSLASTLDTVWIRVVDLLAARGRGLAARLGLAYPLARRFRTSMLLGMFSLVIFTMTFISSLSGVFTAQAGSFTDEARAGYDLLVGSNPANPVTEAELLSRDEVTAVAGLSTTWARYSTDFTDAPRAWAISGFDRALLALDPPELMARAEAYASDDETFAAVLTDPTLALVPDTFLQDGGPGSDRVELGDTFEVMDPSTGESRELTAAGLLGTDFVFNGVMVSRELTGELFGAQDVVTRHYVAVDDGVDADGLAATLNVDLLANGGDAASFAALVDDALSQETGFLSLLQAFLGLGLLVGIAGLGVVMVRAVRERRQEIGMLRAMGFPTGLVRAAFLSEAALIALQGTAIGAILGLITARQVFLSTDVFGDAVTSFTIPWAGLAVIALLPVAASLAATAWPAARAAAIRPAVALRVAD